MSAASHVPGERSRAHEFVADQLRRQIALRLLPPGSALPAERALMATFSAGRGTIQRALALLKEDGLIERRRGRSGGTFVTEALEESPYLQRSIDRVRASRDEIDAALRFRAEVEPALVAEACRRRTLPDVEAMRDAEERLARSTTDTQFMRYDNEFHLAVSAAAHNRYFEQAASAIRLALNDAIWVLPGTQLWLERTLSEHKAILIAIDHGDASAGRTAARTHVLHTEQSIRALLASLS